MSASFILAVLAILTGISSGWAQMFATVQECDVRYGKPTSNTDQTSDVRFYKHDDMKVKVLFVEGKAMVITYLPMTSLKMSDAVQQKILDTNAGGEKWEEVLGEGARTWQRSDGQAFAIYDTVNGELNLFSTEYIEKSKAEVQTAINQR